MFNDFSINLLGIYKIVVELERHRIIVQSKMDQNPRFREKSRNNEFDA